MAMSREFRWAASTLLQMNNLPASPTNIAAFENSRRNQQWINVLIKAAQPMSGSMTSGTYDKVINILTANGVVTNIYGPGNGSVNNITNI